MAVPDFQTLMRPVLAAAGDGFGSVKSIIPRVAAEFNLTEEDLSAMLPSGRQTVISNRLHWARQYMGKAGLLESVKRGEFRITQRGREFLRDHPARIDTAVLARVPEFESWHGRSGGSSQEDISPHPAQRVVGELTPEDQIDQAALEIGDALVTDLLARVSKIDPKGFERLILDVLRAMGYGGGLDSMYRMTQASNDGGIDGVINEDALGLDSIYIQAKRYAAENRVGREALQAFVGSLTGEGASKGVFVTTSSFSRHAAEYAARLQNHRVVLINGEKLARLMIAHDVGVRAVQTYVIKEIDENYFPDD